MSQINYYETNANKYIEETINCNMDEQYQLFLKYMPKEGLILDIGFGSGRDLKYFKSLGYEVEGIDPTPSFYQKMLDQNYNVRLLKSEDLNEHNKYDGIWACASLLHVESKNLNKVFQNISNALKENGIFYCSFKYGSFEGMRNYRYFTYLDEEHFNKLLENTNLTILETSITHDVRSDRSSEEWLNVVLKKSI